MVDNANRSRIEFGKRLLFLFAIIALAFAQTTNLEKTLQDLCTFLYDVVGSLAFLMVLMGSVVHAAGQMFPAEYRARANVYSWNLVMGAFIGILIIILVPWIIGLLAGMDFDANSCTFSPR